MTGFGRGESANDEWKVTAYARSVNGKGLDITVRAPSFILPLDPKIKEVVKENIKRGTVYISLEIEPLKASIPIDRDLLIENIANLKDLTRHTAGLNVDDSTIFQIAWKYAEKTSTQLTPALEKAIVEAVKEAVWELKKSRETEGKVLKNDLLRRLEIIKDMMKKIIEKKDEIIERTKTRVIERAKKLNLGEDHPTVLSEIVFILEKMDIEEEVTRLKAHIDRFENSFEGEEVGKRLEFIAQEMHREITTLGNKIPDLSEYVVNIKTEIDRIKQQSANLE